MVLWVCNSSSLTCTCMCVSAVCAAARTRVGGCAVRLHMCVFTSVPACVWCECSSWLHMQSSGADGSCVIVFFLACQ
jgi:hypothetical protein